LQLNTSISASYGFPIDPDLSVKKYVQVITGNMPADLYFTQVQNVAFHNLCTTSKFPASIKSLLISSKKSTRGISDINTQDWFGTLSFACFLLIMWNHTDDLLIGFLPYGCLLKEIYLSISKKG